MFGAMGSEAKEGERRRKSRSRRRKRRTGRGTRKALGKDTKALSKDRNNCCLNTMTKTVHERGKIRWQTGHTATVTHQKNIQLQRHQNTSMIQ